jgi:cold shock CspA family protein
VRKDRDSRRPQRQGFDDDNYSPPDRFGFTPRESGPRFEASSAGPPVQATVKWYNPEKGFGFVGLASGGDAFLHVSVVERSGNSTVPPGATLEVRIGAGQKGQQVTEILSVDTSTALQEPARRARPAPRHAPTDQAAVEALRARGARPDQEDQKRRKIEAAAERTALHPAPDSSENPDENSLAGHLDRSAGLRFLAHLMHFASSRAGAVDLGGLLAFATALSALFAKILV